jgi:hypothetical protein
MTEKDLFDAHHKTNSGLSLEWVFFQKNDCVTTIKRYN